MKQDFVVNTVEQDDACYLFAFFDVVDSTNLQLSISLPRTKTNWSRFEMKFFDLTSLISFTTSLGRCIVADHRLERTL